MKINFEKFPMFTNIRKDDKREVNVKYELANLLYTKGQGVVCGALAMKIYQSEGEMEITEMEYNTLSAFVEQFSPIFADSMKSYLKECSEAK